ncbi:carbamoyl-phosphate synthase domain-containing protein, partial [Pseudomonas syringae group genomosp. 7]|uniref:carbamoyl-phosphate synthase domain-containing protein n=1 Tax=Pseudomonas syringae group genomosp. 7 TaxID=251699 RepID=UPI0037705A1F
QTYPHIGFTGTNPEDAESDRVWSAGLVIGDLPLVASNWRIKLSLGDYLKANNFVAIAGIDTRRLTRILRDKVAHKGCILA